MLSFDIRIASFLKVGHDNNDAESSFIDETSQRERPPARFAT
jgi:hypothetical protein